MSYTTPQLDAAAAVAEMLTGREIAGFTLDAKADNLLPTYDQSKGDLDELHVDCIPDPTFRFVRENRSMVLEDCPVNIGVQINCGPEDQLLYRQLLALLRGIAKVVALEAPTGFRPPLEDVEVIDRPDAVDADGRFFGVIGAVYRVETEAA